MVSNHARKNAARARRSGNPDENHRQATDAVRHDDPDTVLVVDYPAPRLDGTDPCGHCNGAGTSGETWEQPSAKGRPPLLVDVVCRTCAGCGRAEHDRCAPGAHATDDPDEIAVHLDDILGEYDQEAQAERCLSCHGWEFWYTGGMTLADEKAAAAGEQLAARAQAAGVSEWDMAAAATFGELDELLGDGAQALARAADTTVYLRMPCGCTEDRVRTVRRADLATA